MRTIKTYFGLSLLPVLLTPALADVLPPEPESAVMQKQPRSLGQKAVLHIYYYAPKTLEITYVDSYLFKDEDACKDAINTALQIATQYAGAGDLVSAKCVGMEPPDLIRKREGNPEPSNPQEST